MKKVLLLLIGILPLPIGYGLNMLMLGACYNVALPYGWIGIGLLAVWFVFGKLARPLGGTAFKSALIAHIPALAVLALLLYQELALGRYWLNAFGAATQIFYLPLINLAAKVVFFSQSLSIVYVMAFLLLFAAFWVGGRLRNQTQKQQA